VISSYRTMRCVACSDDNWRPIWLWAAAIAPRWIRGATARR